MSKIKLKRALEKDQIWLLISILVFSAITLVQIAKAEALSKEEIQRELLHLWRERNVYKELLIDASESFVPETELKRDLYNILQNESSFSGELQYKALKKLSEIEEPSTLGSFLIKYFKETNSLFLKKTIIRHLAGNDDWIPFLVSVSRGKTSLPEKEEILLRLEAFKALFSWQIKIALPDFISFLSEIDLPPEQNLLENFDDRILPYLCALLNSSSNKVKKLALKTLLESSFKTHVCLELPLNDPNPEIRALSLKVLFRHEPGEALKIAKMIQEESEGNINNLTQAILIALDGKPANRNPNFELWDSEVVEICAQTEKGINYLLNKALLEGRVEKLLNSLTQCSYVSPSSMLWLTLKENNWEPLTLLRFFPEEKTKWIVLKKLQEGKVPPKDFQISFTYPELRNNYHILRKIFKEGETKAKLYLIPLLWPLQAEVLPLLEEILRQSPPKAVLAEIIRLLETVQEPASLRFLSRISTYPDIEIKIQAYLALLKKL